MGKTIIQKEKPMAKLEKKSHKSLIFLLIKQRNVINSLARQIKQLLADKAQYVPIERYNDLKKQYDDFKELYNGLEFVCQSQDFTLKKQAQKIEELKEALKQAESRPAERSVSNA